MLYIVWNRSIWSRSKGWGRNNYTGSNPHTDHVHVSCEADADENTSNWVLDSSGVDDMFCKHGDVGEKVKALQLAVIRGGYDLGPVGGADGQYGNGTAAGLAHHVGGDGRNYGPVEHDRLMAKVYGGSTPGPRGPEGPQGPKGDPGIAPGSKVTLDGTVMSIQ